MAQPTMQPCNNEEDFIQILRDADEPFYRNLDRAWKEACQSLTQQRQQQQSEEQQQRQHAAKLEQACTDPEKSECRRDKVPLSGVSPLQPAASTAAMSAVPTLLERVQSTSSELASASDLPPALTSLQSPMARSAQHGKRWSLLAKLTGTQPTPAAPLSRQSTQVHALCGSAQRSLSVPTWTASSKEPNPFTRQASLRPVLPQAATMPPFAWPPTAHTYATAPTLSNVSPDRQLRAWEAHTDSGEHARALAPTSSSRVLSRNASVGSVNCGRAQQQQTGTRNSPPTRAGATDAMPSASGQHFDALSAVINSRCGDGSHVAHTQGVVAM